MVSAKTLAKMAALGGLSPSNVVPMSATQAKEARRIEDSRFMESLLASKNASGKQDGKYLKRARKRLNARRNFHAQYPFSKPEGNERHQHKAPGSMKK